MATSKPRVQVTLTKASYKALASIAKRHSRSMSSLAGEVLNDMLPSLEKALDLAAELRKLPPEEQAAKRDQLDMWANLGERQLQEHQNRLQSLRKGDTAGSEAEGTRASGAPGRASRPPRTNRGV